MGEGGCERVFGWGVVGRERVARGDATRVESRAAFARTNERLGWGIVLWSPSLAVSRRLSPSLAVSRAWAPTLSMALGAWLRSACVVQGPATSAVTPKTCLFEYLLPRRPASPAFLRGLPPALRPSGHAAVRLGARPRASHVLVQEPAARSERSPPALALLSILYMLCAQICDVPNAFFLTRFSSTPHTPYTPHSPHTPTHASPRPRLVAANRTSTSRT